MPISSSSARFIRKLKDSTNENQTTPTRRNKSRRDTSTRRVSKLFRIVSPSHSDDSDTDTAHSVQGQDVEVLHTTTENKDLQSNYKENGKPLVNKRPFGIMKMYNRICPPSDYTIEREKKLEELRNEKRAKKTISSTDILYNSLINEPVKTYPRKSKSIQPYRSSYSNSNQLSRRSRDVNRKDLHSISPNSPMDIFEMDPEIRFHSTKKFLVYNGIELHGEDITRLQPGNMLNDAIIDFYLLNLQITSASELIHIFNTQFYQLLKRRSEIARYAKTVPPSVNIFEKDFVFIPINESYHWSLIILCYPGDLNHRNHCILYCDSLYSTPGNIFVEYIRDYLTLRYTNETGKRHEFNEENYKVQVASLPLQTNTFDCGVYMIHYIEHFVRNGIPSFPVSLRDLFNASAIQSKRKQIYSLIQKLRSDYTPLNTSQMDESDDEVTLITVDNLDKNRENQRDPLQCPSNDQNPKVKRNIFQRKSTSHDDEDTFEFKSNNTKERNYCSQSSQSEDESNFNNTSHRKTSSTFRIDTNPEITVNRDLPDLNVPESPEENYLHDILETRLEDMKSRPTKRRKIS